MTTECSGAQFEDLSFGLPAVRGFLHRPAVESRRAVVLTHGAGGNSGGPLLVALATTFADRGLTALRCDLPYRQARPTGPPSPSRAARDREGLKHAVLAMRRMASDNVVLAGHSYGGRQASMLSAAEPDLADVPAQPCGRNRGDRSLRGSNPDVRVSICVSRVGPRSTTAALVRGDPAPDRVGR